MLVEQDMLALLHTFQIAAKHLSFTKAGEELFITQGAVSQRIRRLETLLQFRLFIRLTRRLVLTTEAEQLLVSLNQSLQQITEVIEDIRFKELRGMIYIGLPPAFGQLWLMPRLASFKKAFRSLDLYFYGQQGGPMFDTDPVDVVVYYGNNHFPHLHHWPLMEEWLVPVCSPAYATEHGLLTQTEANFEECSLLHCNESLEQFDFDYEWQQWAQATRVPLSSSNRKYVFNQHAMAIESAKHGMGLAMGRWFMVMPAVLRGELVLPVDIKIPAGMGYHLYCTEEHADRPRYRAFAEWMQETVAAWQVIKEASLSVAPSFVVSQQQQPT